MEIDVNFIRSVAETVGFTLEDENYQEAVTPYSMLRQASSLLMEFPLHSDSESTSEQNV